MKPFIITLLLFTVSTVTFSQSVLDEVSTLNKKGEFSKSLKKIEPYAKEHHDFYTQWLYGHTLYQNKKYKKALNIYDQLYNSKNNNANFTLDYITKLISVQELKKAESLLLFLNNIDDYKAFSTKKLAQIYLWQGRYDLAKTTLNQASKLNPNDNETTYISKEIERFTANNASINISRFSDDQPQEYISPEVKTTFYINDKLTIGGKINTPLYSINNQNFTQKNVVATADFALHKLQTTGNLHLGIAQLPSNNTVPDASLKITKRLNKCFNLELSSSYSPYMLTNVSVVNKVMQLQYGGAVNFRNKQGMQGSLTHQIFDFPDENNGYNSTGFWLLSPTLKWSVFKFNLGYGYGQSDSKRSNFAAVETLPNILNNWSENLFIQGYYNPFFTPINQKGHAIIGALEIALSKKINLNGSINYGIKNTVDNPYIYLDTDNQNQTVLSTGFTNINFTPIIINSSINYSISKTFDLNIYYNHQQIIFYKSNLIGAKLNYSF